MAPNCVYRHEPHTARAVSPSPEVAHFRELGKPPSGGVVGGSENSPEEWRPAPAAPAYEVSSLGRVRRSAGSWRRDGAARVLSPRLHPRGYQIVDVTIAGKTTSKTVHKLVCEAFHGPALGRFVDHLNGSKPDNRSENLEWVTAKENTRRAIAMGNHPAAGAVTP